jgi:hypothetical protein
MKIQYRSARILIAAIALLVAGAAKARAQQDEVKTHVPFDFFVSGVEMPAGDYVIQNVDDSPDIVSIRSRDGRQSVYAITIAAADRNNGGEPVVTFDKIGGRYMLTVFESNTGTRAIVVRRPVESTPALAADDGSR